MSRLLHSGGFRVGASIQAIAVVLVLSAAGAARGQDGLGLGTGTASCQLADTSTIDLIAAALSIPLQSSGSVDIRVDEQGNATCDIVEFDPIEITSIGFVCITRPDDSCPSGGVTCPAQGGGAGVVTCAGDCDDSGSVDVSELVVSTNIALGVTDSGECPGLDQGGDGVAINDVVGAVGNAIEGCPGGPTGIGVDLIASRIIGDCTSNEDCDAQCDTYCEGIGKVPTDSGFGCEGFCDGGELDGQTCTEDLDCTGGSCNGNDNVPFGNVCECQCIDTAVGDPPMDGDLFCSLGSSIIVEAQAPCADGDPIIVVGTRCIPLTTSTAQSIINNANGRVCSESGATCRVDEDCPEGQTCDNRTLPMGGPDMATGTPGDCSDIAEGSFTGLGLRGYVNFFGSTLGDLVTKVSVDCL